jgi:hypothetical protein
MKIRNIKEEMTKDMENLRKRIKQKHKTQWKATPENENKWKTESQNSKIKYKLKEKLKNYLSNILRPTKGICKNSPTPSKDQI